MWTVASNTKARKPLQHISINPFKDEHLNDEQVLKIVKHCETKYGYKENEHQRVIVEHIKDGRQHFHVMWNRVSLATGKPIWPGHHWNKSKQAAREMEQELGLKRPMPKRVKRLIATVAKSGRIPKQFGRYQTLGLTTANKDEWPLRPMSPKPEVPNTQANTLKNKYKKLGVNKLDPEKIPFRRPDLEASELLAWAWENQRADILAQFGVYVDFGL